MQLKKKKGCTREILFYVFFLVDLVNQKELFEFTFQGLGERMHGDIFPKDPWDWTSYTFVQMGRWSKNLRGSQNH